jgi:hypothetical protein
MATDRNKLTPEPVSPPPCCCCGDPNAAWIIGPPLRPVTLRFCRACFGATPEGVSMFMSMAHEDLDDDGNMPMQRVPTGAV